MAAIAGIGFAGFFICIDRAGDSSALWSAVNSRIASLVIVAVIVLFRRVWLRESPARLQPAGAVLAVFAGCLDVTGTALFIRAEQTGRLDTAVVLSSLYPVITVCAGASWFCTNALPDGKQLAFSPRCWQCP